MDDHPTLDPPPPLGSEVAWLERTRKACVGLAQAAETTDLNPEQQGQLDGAREAWKRVLGSREPAQASRMECRRLIGELHALGLHPEGEEPW